MSETRGRAGGRVTTKGGLQRIIATIYMQQLRTENTVLMCTARVLWCLPRHQKAALVSCVAPTQPHGCLPRCCTGVCGMTELGPKGLGQLCGVTFDQSVTVFHFGHSSTRLPVCHSGFTSPAMRRRALFQCSSLSFIPLICNVTSCNKSALSFKH